MAPQHIGARDGDDGTGVNGTEGLGEQLRVCTHMWTPRVLACLLHLPKVMAKPAQQASMALVAQVVKADALLLGVEVHNGG